MSREELSFNEYVDKAWRTFGQHNEKFREKILLSALGLAGESGEYVDMIKKLCFHDHTIDTDKVKEELGDILWYLGVTCKVWGFSLDQVARSNLEKLEKRYPEGFSAERSRSRGDA